jgi:prolyl-tRNA editing enzyme YbaK/EbsC (Cys-tRNA(Pro) deacylase)
VSDLWGPAELALFLQQHAPTMQLVANLGETPTVPAAAAALGVESDQIIKTLLFVVDGPASASPGGGERAAEMVVVISNGERRVDKGALAVHFGVGKKRITLAPAELVAAQVGYAVGGVPPVGHRSPLPVLLDASVQEAALRYGGIFYGGGGDDRTMLRLTLDDLLRLTRATVVPLSSQP